jgi:hypothetical protein
MSIKNYPPEPYSLWARAGNTFRRIVTWTDANDTPIDLTGASVEWNLKDKDNLFEFKDDASVSIVDPLAGSILIHLSPEQTRELQPRVWRYELIVTFNDGFRITILDGFLSTSKSTVNGELT